MAKKKEYFKSPKAKKDYDKFIRIYNKLEKPLDNYFDFIEPMVKDGLIDEKVESRITGMTADLDAIKLWFEYELKEAKNNQGNPDYKIKVNNIDSLIDGFDKMMKFS